MKISAYRNRLAVDISQHTGINEVRNGGNPFHWNGSAVQFELAFFNNGTLINDLSNIDQVQIELKRLDDKTGLAVMGKVLASGSLNGGLTQEDWTAGLEDDCHALISFDGSESDIDLQGELTGEFWLVVSALRNDGEPITLGCVQYSVEEDGRGTSVPAGVSTPIYYTAAQSDARYVMALDLTTIETNVATLQTQMTTANTNISSVTTTANAALPKAGGALTGQVTMAVTPTLSTHLATKGYADGFLPLAGGTLTGLLTLSGAPTSTLHAATKAYADLKLPLAGGTLTGLLTLSGAPTNTLHAATKGYVDTAVAGLVNSSPGALDTLKELADALGDDPNFATTMTTALAAKLALAGGTMTGHITLYTGTTPSGNQAIGKTFADGTYLALAGGALTGQVTMAVAPTASGHLATKSYVDTQDALRLALTGGVLSGGLSFSGTGHAGITVNSLTTTQRDALTAANGMLIYNTTSSAFERREGNTWKQFTSGTTGGVSLLSAAGVPAVGSGVDGDFYINEANGDIYKRTAGVWSVIVDERLSVNGGSMDAGIVFNAYGGDDQIYFTGDATVDWSLSLATGDDHLLLRRNGLTHTQFFDSGIKITGVSAGEVWIDGNRVVTVRQAAITAPTGGTTIDTNARTAINAIRAALTAHGLTA